jgi:3-oxoacyl-(acyl-carrier-protein) synthase
VLSLRHDNRKADEDQDERKMARFAQYAMVASEEALADAEWSPRKKDDLEATVNGFQHLFVDRPN